MGKMPDVLIFLGQSWIRPAAPVCYPLNTPLHSQKCSHLDGALYGHSTYGSHFEICVLPYGSLTANVS